MHRNESIRLPLHIMLRSYYVEREDKRNGKDTKRSDERRGGASDNEDEGRRGDKKRYGKAFFSPTLSHVNTCSIWLTIGPISMKRRNEICGPVPRQRLVGDKRAVILV